MQRELPGLVSKGFTSTGKYGIGFFSVFMLGDHVQVVTRRPDEARAQTRVLEFQKGVTARPLLREARDGEIPLEAGTRVRVNLLTDPQGKGGLLHSYREDSPRCLDLECGTLCPAIDANLYVEPGDGRRCLAVSGSDWITVPGAQLLMRLSGLRDTSTLQDSASIAGPGSNLRLLRNRSGHVVGRACIGGGWFLERTGATGTTPGGVVTAGGLRSCRLDAIQGNLVGEPLRTTRDDAVPVVEDEELARWATGQASLVRHMTSDPAVLVRYAAAICECGGDTQDLPVAECASGFVSLTDLRGWAGGRAEVLISIDAPLTEARSRGMRYSLHDHVLVTQWARPTFLRGGHGAIWPRQYRRLTDMIVEAVAEAWAVPAAEIGEHVRLSGVDEVYEREIGKLAGRSFLAAHTLSIRR